MGAIAVETRTIERIVPADPANASSMEQKIMEAGQVSISAQESEQQTDNHLRNPGLVPQLSLQDRSSYL